MSKETTDLTLDRKLNMLMLGYKIYKRTVLVNNVT